MWIMQHTFLYLAISLTHQAHAAPTPRGGLSPGMNLAMVRDLEVTDRTNTLFSPLLADAVSTVSMEHDRYTLRPVSEIFFAITRADRTLPTAVPTPTYSLEDSTAPIALDSAFEIGLAAPTVLPSDRPPIRSGPGLVLLSSAVFYTQGTFPPVPGATSNPTTFGTQGKNLSSPHLTKFEVVGGVIGGVAAITLCLFFVFFLLDPRVSRGCRSRTPGSKNLRQRPVLSWLRSPPPSATARECNYVNHKKELYSFEKGGNLTPRSKFSIASSGYTQSTRDSATTSDSDVVVEPQVSTTSPVRPPRPPTADSPATISDSVYFACEKQQEDEAASILAQHAQATDMDADSSSFESPLLSPMIFFSISPPPSPSTTNLSPRENTRHSRTHSAPIFKGNPMADLEGDSCLDPVAMRVLKHRRSRSASGWAYRRSKDLSEYPMEASVVKAC